MWWWIGLAAWLLVSPVIGIVVGMVLRFEQAAFPQTIDPPCTCDDIGARVPVTGDVSVVEPALVG